MRAITLLFVAVLSVVSMVASDAPLRVGLILTGSATDGGWNQLAAQAAQRLVATGSAKVTVLQKVPQDKAGDELRDFVSEGYDLVIAHGYEYLNPAAEVATAGGKTKLAVCGADLAKPNLATYDFDVSQASYQLGVVAARMSRSGKLGFIGGAPIPSVKACYRGFLAGAMSVRPECTVAETYTSWDQPERSKAQSEALFAQGVDVIYQDVDAASRGVFEAVAEQTAAGKTVWAVGCVANQNANPVCAQRMLGSAVIDLGRVFARLVQDVRTGQFKPGLHREDLASEVCVPVLNPSLVGTVIPAAVVEEADQAVKKLVVGAVVFPR